MVSIKKAFKNDEVDIIELIKFIWKKKFLIFFISFIFTFFALIYYSLSDKIYKTDIFFNKLPINKFQPLLNYFDKNSEVNLSNTVQKYFCNEFNNNLSSAENLKQYLKKNGNTNVSKNLIVSMTPIGNKEFCYIGYTLIFKKPLAGDKFLNEYIELSILENLNQFDKILIEIINYKIDLYSFQLKIANAIGLEKPHPSFLEDYYTDQLYLKGSRVLSLEIENMKKDLKKISSELLEAITVRSKPSKPSLISRSLIHLMTFSIITSLIVSTLLLFFRFIISKN